jgi:hypothetical protein
MHSRPGASTTASAVAAEAATPGSRERSMPASECNMSSALSSSTRLDARIEQCVQNSVSVAWHASSSSSLEPICSSSPLLASMSTPGLSLLRTGWSWSCWRHAGVRCDISASERRNSSCPNVGMTPAGAKRQRRVLCAPQSSTPSCTLPTAQSLRAVPRLSAHRPQESGLRPGEGCAHLRSCLAPASSVTTHFPTFICAFIVTPKCCYARCGIHMSLERYLLT